MKIMIERVTNGYVVTCPDDGLGVDKEGSRNFVIEEKDAEYGEQEAFVLLCYELLNLLGISNSKHNARRINIELTNEANES